MRELPIDPVKIPHRHAWLWEPLEERATFELRSMFGAKAIYLDGKIIACFCIKEEPWRGMLLCTDREHHAALLAEFPALSVHPILGKWLYLPEVSEQFDPLAENFIRLALKHDPRIGTIPKPKKKRPRRKA